jgi:hypothetical protein
MEANMLERKSKGVRIEFAESRLRIDAEIAFNWRKIGIFATTLLCILLVIGSSIDEDLQDILLQSLLGILQGLLFHTNNHS